jgi:hypothetical protein
MPMAEWRLPIGIQPARVHARHTGILCLLAGLVALAGCGGTTFQVCVEKPVAQRAQWAVAVFPLDDSGTQGTIQEYAVYGHTGAQGSGAMLARGILQALDASGQFRSVNKTAFRNLLLTEKITLTELSGLDDWRAGELGRKLGADMIVRGRIIAFDNSWLFFMRKATVRLELRGLDAATGETIWTATLGESSMSRSEATLISKIADDAVRAIRQGVGAPQ